METEVKGRRSREKLEHKPLLLLLAFSWLLRIALILQGGPLNWPDDVRYFRTNTILENLKTFQFGAALDPIIKPPDHNFFAAVAFIPAVARLVVTKSIAAAAGLFGLSFPTDVSSTIWIAASVLSLASVVNIGLVYALARKVGSTRREALLAAFLMACATSTFHLTRFLVPYEASLAFALTAMWIGLDARRSFTRSYFSGLLGGLAFFTYNGHWTIVVVVVGAHILRGGSTWREALRRASASAVGLLTPLGLLIGVQALRGTELYFAGARRFSTKVIQGDFSEGWSLPWAYFWHAEHAILFLWMVGAVVLLQRFIRSRKTSDGAGLLWLASAMGVYLLLILSSNVVHLFVVTGRFANQMVPFFCLATASAIAQLPPRFSASRKFVVVLLGAISLQAACNFSEVFRQNFPYEIRQQVRAQYPGVAEDVTVYGTLWRMEADGNAVLDDFRIEKGDGAGPRARYVLLNAGVPFLPIQGPKEPPRGKILFKARHMMAYRPYQYQAFKPNERAVLRSTDFSLELIDTADTR